MTEMSEEVKLSEENEGANEDYAEDIEEVLDYDEGNHEEIKTPDEKINQEDNEVEDSLSIFVPTDLNEVAIAGEFGHLDGVSKMLGNFVLSKINYQNSKGQVLQTFNMPPR